MTSGIVYPHSKNDTDKQESQRPLHYLILGDGDFSYAYDLARYLSQLHQERPWRLVATGWDTRNNLLTKYTDAKFFVQHLEAMNRINNAEVKILHGVNAIVNNTDKNAEAPCTATDADVVIFNHPHIGTEDAVRHAQFLSHFFASAVSTWMRQNCGVLYLTLVQGQWERWEGTVAANRQGLRLVHGSQPWVDVPLHDQSRYYQLRRHQSGKSFASRRPASLVYCLTRTNPEREDSPRKIPPYPFGYAASTNNYPTSEIRTHEPSSDALFPTKNNLQQLLPFACTLCEKRFQQERSLRNHVTCKHTKHDNDGPSTKKIKVTEWKCNSCDRTFATAQGWQDHVQAKHDALHRDIRPDWSQARQEEKGDSTGGGFKCTICGWTISSLVQHWNTMVPNGGSAESYTASFACTYCAKEFREQRARLQHENVCRYH